MSTHTISTGSIIKFDVAFSIPVNNDFSKIVIFDTLSNGLTALSAVVTVDSVPTGTPAVTVVTVPNNFKITLNNTIATTASVKAIKATLTVLVSNAPAYIADISPIPPATVYEDNLAYILPYDNSDNPLPSSAAEAKTPQDFRPCSSTFYGFGSSTRVGRVAGESAPLITAFPAMYSFENLGLIYKLTIEPAEELTFDPGATNAVTAYVGAPENLVPTALIWKNYTASVLTITLPHTAAMKNNLVYVISETKTNSLITAVPATEDIITSQADLDLIYGGNIVCSAPHFTATTALINTIPKLAATKIIL